MRMVLHAPTASARTMASELRRLVGAFIRARGSSLPWTHIIADEARQFNERRSALPHPPTPVQSFDEFISALERDREHGTTICLCSIAEILNTPILILKPSPAHPYHLAFFWFPAAAVGSACNSLAPHDLLARLSSPASLSALTRCTSILIHDQNHYTGVSSSAALGSIHGIPHREVTATFSSDAHSWPGAQVLPSLRPTLSQRPPDLALAGDPLIELWSTQTDIPDCSLVKLSADSCSDPLPSPPRAGPPLASPASRPDQPKRKARLPPDAVPWPAQNTPNCSIIELLADSYDDPLPSPPRTARPPAPPTSPGQPKKRARLPPDSSPASSLCRAPAATPPHRARGRGHPAWHELLEGEAPAAVDQAHPNAARQHQPVPAAINMPNVLRARPQASFVVAICIWGAEALPLRGMIALLTPLLARAADWPYKDGNYKVARITQPPSRNGRAERTRFEVLVPNTDPTLATSHRNDTPAPGPSTRITEIPADLLALCRDRSWHPKLYTPWASRQPDIRLSPRLPRKAMPLAWPAPPCAASRRSPAAPPRHLGTPPAISHPTHPVLPPARIPVVLCTLNVHHLAPKIEEVVEMMTDLDASACFLQETLVSDAGHPNLALLPSHLIIHLGLSYPDMEGARYLATICRRQGFSTHLADDRASNASVLTIMCSINDTVVILLNVYINPNSAPLCFGRLNSALTHVTSKHPKTTVIIGGDFNSLGPAVVKKILSANPGIARASLLLPCFRGPDATSKKAKLGRPIKAIDYFIIYTPSTAGTGSLSFATQDVAGVPADDTTDMQTDEPDEYASLTLDSPLAAGLHYRGQETRPPPESPAGLHYRGQETRPPPESPAGLISRSASGTFWQLVIEDSTTSDHLPVALWMILDAHTAGEAIRRSSSKALTILWPPARVAVPQNLCWTTVSRSCTLVTSLREFSDLAETRNRVANSPEWIILAQHYRLLLAELSPGILLATMPQCTPTIGHMAALFFSSSASVAKSLHLLAPAPLGLSLSQPAPPISSPAVPLGVPEPLREQTRLRMPPPDKTPSRPVRAISNGTTSSCSSPGPARGDPTRLLHQLLRDRAKIVKRWRLNGSTLPLSEADRDTLGAIQSRIDLAINTREVQSYRSLRAGLISDAIRFRLSNPACFWRLVNRLLLSLSGLHCDTERGRGPPPVLNPQCIWDSDGHLCTEPALIQRVWELFWAARANPEQPQDYDWEKMVPLPQHPHRVELDGLISWGELLAETKKSHVFSAAGPSGMQYFWITCATDVEQELSAQALSDTPPLAPSTPMGECLMSLVQTCWVTSSIPDVLNHSLLTAVFKKGDRCSPGDYRPISLLEPIVKLLEGILATRMANSFESTGFYDSSQAGFRKFEESISHAVALYEACIRRLHADLPTMVLFMDFKAAFDSVSHRGLLYKLQKAGVMGRALAMISSLYKNQWNSVRTNGIPEVGSPFGISSGAREGSKLSPVIFLVFINDFLPTMGRFLVVPGLRNPAGTWQFADDSAAAAAEVERMRLIALAASNWSKANLLAFGIKKCGLLLVNCTEAMIADLEENPICLNGEAVPIVSQYKYLGLYMNDTLNLQCMISARIAACSLSLGTIRNFLQDPMIPLAMKLDLIRSRLLPCLTFGGELFGAFPVENMAPLDAILGKAFGLTLGVELGKPALIILCTELKIVLPSVAMMSSAVRLFRKMASSSTIMADLIRSQLDGAGTSVGPEAVSWEGRRRLSWTARAKRLVDALPMINKVRIPQTLVKRAFMRERCASLAALALPPHQADPLLPPPAPSPPSNVAQFLSNFRPGSNQFMRHWMQHVSTTGRFEWEAGVVGLLFSRSGNLYTGPRLARAKRLPPIFLTKCPCCQEPLPETIHHILVDCRAWGDIRYSHLTPAIKLAADAIDHDQASLEAAGCFGSRSMTITLLLLGGYSKSLSLGNAWHTPFSPKFAWSKGPEGLLPVYLSVVKFLSKMLPLRRVFLASAGLSTPRLLASPPDAPTSDNLDGNDGDQASDDEDAPFPLLSPCRRSRLT